MYRTRESGGNWAYRLPPVMKIELNDHRLELLTAAVVEEEPTSFPGSLSSASLCRWETKGGRGERAWERG